MKLPIEWLPASGTPDQLIVLLHGWGSRALSMQPLAQALREDFPQAAILAPDAPHPVDGGGRGRQWYSISELDDATWQRRVQATLPQLQRWLRAQQHRLHVGPAATALGGFSQGAILSMALALHDDGIAGRVLAFGGCLVGAPHAAPQHTTLHLFHGSEDTVIPAERSRTALEQLGALQGDATIDIAEGVGHLLHPVLIECARHRLRSHIPARTWRAALGAVPGAAAGAAPGAALGAMPSRVPGDV